MSSNRLGPRCVHARSESGSVVACGGTSIDVSAESIRANAVVTNGTERIPTQARFLQLRDTSRPFVVTLKKTCLPRYCHGIVATDDEHRKVLGDATLDGVVVDENGRPVEGAHVEAATPVGTAPTIAEYGSQARA